MSKTEKIQENNSNETEHAFDFLPFDQDFTSDSSGTAALPMNSTERATPQYRQKDGGKTQRDPIQYSILTHLGSLSISRNGWKREVNIVSWNKRQPRLDIRDWDPTHIRMGRGVGLNASETENLLALLKGFDIKAAGI